MDRVLSVVAAMCLCQQHCGQDLARARTPPTFSPGSYQSHRAPHLQPILTPMCYHLTLLILCTQPHVEAYAQVYE